MAGRRVKSTQIPDRASQGAWDDFIHWLRGYTWHIDAQGLQVLTIRGWEIAKPTDWIMRLPGRELYLMPDRRWRAAAPVAPCVDSAAIVSLDD